ncbi:MAG: 3'-5' exonuclease [Deltaproteobacteria bacterium]
MKRAQSERLPPQDPQVVSDWDMRVGEAPLAFFDFEMTGLDPDLDRIVEIAVVRVHSGGVVGELDTLLNPGAAVRAGGRAIHGIDPVALSSAPRFDAIVPELRAVFAGAIPVGHGTDLDALFLSRALERLGAEPSPIATRLDTLTLARRSLNAPSYTLPALTARLGLPDRRWHRAHDDALAVRAVFDAVVPAFGVTTPSDLWQVRIGQREAVVVRDAIAASLEALAESGARCEITLRTPGKEPTTLVAHVEQWSPPHARCVDARRRMRVVRADRILRIAPGVSGGARAR